MKKTSIFYFNVIPFLLIFILITSIFADAQTSKPAPSLEETKQFLKTYYSVLLPPGGGCEKINFIYSTKKISWNLICNYTDTVEGFIIPSLVKGISFDFIPFEKYSAYEERPAQWNILISTATEDISINIHGMKDKSYIEKFVKALSRFVKLSGAKLVDKDLFDK